MLNLRRLFKNYDETGSFNEQINLYGFVDDHLFLTKTGDLGAVLEVRGVDFECLDGTTVDALTKRLESALKLFDEKIHEEGGFAHARHAFNVYMLCKVDGKVCAVY